MQWHLLNMVALVRFGYGSHAERFERFRSSVPTGLCVSVQFKGVPKVPGSGSWKRGSDGSGFRFRVRLLCGDSFWYADATFKNFNMIDFMHSAVLEFFPNLFRRSF